MISTLYSSFVTQSYEDRLGVYGKDLYLSNLNKSIYKELPLMKRYIVYLDEVNAYFFKRH